MHRRSLAIFAVASALTISLAGAELDLAKQFASPPPAARPWVYWFWVNGNITREGITADLEAMQRVGIGGVVLFDVTTGAPEGNVAYLGPQWRALLEHAMREADRLGLEVNINNGGGWAGSSGPWIDPAHSMQKLVWSETTVEGPQRFASRLAGPPTNYGFYRDVAVLAVPAVRDFRIPAIDAKAFFERREISTGTVEVPREAVIDRNQIVNLSSRLRGDDIEWEVPPGKWMILRFGYTTTGATSPTAPASGLGLEADRLSREAIDEHFAAVVGSMPADQALVATHVDSWEAGTQNWTARMPQEFLTRRGYDVVPFLPVITGRVIDSVDTSERFLWDWRQTISQLLLDNYAARLRALANGRGLRLSIEAYDAPVDDIAYAARADEPMCEFWTAGDGRGLCKEMASAAHTYGKRIVGAESFTAGNAERWLLHPGLIKALGDARFADGANRLVVHRYAMQPWLHVAPGMSMGHFGLHYERTQTWWEYSRPWHEYLARTQFMLRQGKFVADICYVRVEDTPLGEQHYPRRGYDFDECTPEIVRTMTVRGGRVTLPTGMSYRILVLPKSERMTVSLLRRIQTLIKDGATIAGLPPKRSAGLPDAAGHDAEIRRRSREVWQDCDGTALKERRYGKGKVVCGGTPEEALAAMGVPPDVTCASGAVRAIHRSVGGMQVYFLANVADGMFAIAVPPVETTCSFRVTRSVPELLDPEVGRISPVNTYEVANGVTRIPLQFSASGSVFVVFREEAQQASRRVVSIKRDGRELLFMNDEPGDWRDIDLARREIRAPGIYAITTADGKSRAIDASRLPEPYTIVGPWQLDFGPTAHQTVQQLASWSTSSDPALRYYSGQATYTRTFTLPAQISPKSRLYLDLGRVEAIARVAVNGKDLGVLWKQPYRVDVTDVVHSGENALSIKVVNLWPNRMIGDENLPEDGARLPDGALKEWPQWLLEGHSNPTGRSTFTTWRLWKKDEPLIASGLLGPVTLRVTMKISAE